MSWFRLSKCDRGVTSLVRRPSWAIHLIAIALSTIDGFAAADNADNAPAQSDNPTAAWIREHAVSFPAAAPTQDVEALDPLGKMVGDARIVALGEGTHGTREFFQMKHWITRYLAERKGFTVFAIEANMPEAQRLNDYILHGKGEPRELMKGMYFWTWNTEAVLELVEWMRAYNESGQGRMMFTGFDMQTPTVAMELVEGYLKETSAELYDRAHQTFELARTSRIAQPSAFGVATATFPVEEARGKTVRYSGKIRTENISEGFAGLWWRVDGDSGVLAFDNMADDGPRGTSDWAEHTLELKVPAEAVNINFGVLLVGPGTAWFDDLTLRVDGASFDLAPILDSGFEAESIRGFFTGGEGYQTTLDGDIHASGKQSLKMTHSVKESEDAVAADELARQCADLISTMESRREALVAKAPAAAFERALQNARIVQQSFEMKAGVTIRDLSMARNVKWIVEQAGENGKVVLWAHNGHVARRLAAMGQYLDTWYKDEMVVIGFAAGEGRYTAIDREDGVLRSDHALQEPSAGSFEWMFRQANCAPFILDLREAMADNDAASWLTEPHPFRAVGALAMDEQFQPARLQDEYDIIIYFDKTTPTKPLK